IRAGCEHSLALTSTGEVLAWGANRDGELGNGSTTPSDVPIPVPLTVGTTVKAISTGQTHSLALTSTGQVLAWGDNESGQLGIGTVTRSSTTPVTVKLPAGTKAAGVAATQFDSLTLTSTGQVLIWGDNGFGELGNGSTTRLSSTPVKAALPSGTTVRSLFGGGGHVLALTSRCKLLAWGDKVDGQLGTGAFLPNSISRPVQVKLPTRTTVTAITGGIAQSFALTSAGQVLSWGANSVGELGDGTTTDRDSPVRVKLLAGVTGVAIGAGPTTFTGMAIVRGPATAGVLRAWGANAGGELGDGTSTNSAVPVNVHLPPGAPVTSARIGCFHTLALASDGQALAWGNNVSGQLGNGSNAPSPIPVQVKLPAGVTVKAIRAGCDHSLALTTSGGLLGWGDNSFGQLGIGSAASNESTPVHVGAPEGEPVKAVTAGSER